MGTPPAHCEPGCDNGVQGIDEKGDPSSIHLFPAGTLSLVGQAAAPVLGTVCPGLGGGLPKGQATG